MGLQLAQSKTAQEAYSLVRELQAKLVSRLESFGKGSHFERIEWLRAEGKFGGGWRYVASEEAIFNRASVNISQVQYENDPLRKLGSATAISTIVHPYCPFAPSMHMHISWTETKSGDGYWRIMGDLNPGIFREADQAKFIQAFSEIMPEPLCSYGQEQGSQYFYIPALGRHRGVAHFYLEEYSGGDRHQDLELARSFGNKVIDVYSEIVTTVLRENHIVSPADRQQQLAYHSLYFLQVLTLDRGTTSGLLVHDENDTGILGSLPSHVDKALLASWTPKLPSLQQILWKQILQALPESANSLVDDNVKRRIAQVTREFYQQYPEAQELLAKGDRVPPTQQNHK